MLGEEEGGGEKGEREREAVGLHDVYCMIVWKKMHLLSYIATAR
jgi:hypothetical protein